MTTLKQQLTASIALEQRRREVRETLKALTNALEAAEALYRNDITRSFWEEPMRRPHEQMLRNVRSCCRKDGEIESEIMALAPEVER